MVDMGEMMKQVQKMQSEMKEASAELARETITTGAGKGAIKITMNGQMKVLSLDIDPNLAPMNDMSRFSDMLKSVLNEAIEKAQDIGQEKMKRMTKYINMPGLSDLLK